MKHCSTLTLARRHNWMIEYCSDCQVMHLQLDSITLKIERESLGALHELLDEALTNLGLFEHHTKALLAHFGKGRRSASN